MNNDQEKDDESVSATILSKPVVASSDRPIPLPYFNATPAEKKPTEENIFAKWHDFELDDGNEEMLLADNAPLLMKLRETERNRRSKMREAAKNT